MTKILNSFFIKTENKKSTQIQNILKNNKEQSYLEHLKKIGLEHKNDIQNYLYRSAQDSMDKIRSNTQYLTHAKKVIGKTQESLLKNNRTVENRFEFQKLFTNNPQNTRISTEVKMKISSLDQATESSFKNIIDRIGFVEAGNGSVVSALLDQYKINTASLFRTQDIADWVKANDDGQLRHQEIMQILNKNGSKIEELVGGKNREADLAFLLERFIHQKGNTFASLISQNQAISLGSIDLGNGEYNQIYLGAGGTLFSSKESENAESPEHIIDQLLTQDQRKFLNNNTLLNFLHHIGDTQTALRSDLESKAAYCEDLKKMSFSNQIFEKLNNEESDIYKDHKFLLTEKNKEQIFYEDANSGDVLSFMRAANGDYVFGFIPKDPISKDTQDPVNPLERTVNLMLPHATKIFIIDDSKVDGKEQYRQVIEELGSFDRAVEHALKATGLKNVRLQDLFGDKLFNSQGQVVLKEEFAQHLAFLDALSNELDGFFGHQDLLVSGLEERQKRLDLELERNNHHLEDLTANPDENTKRLVETNMQIQLNESLSDVEKALEMQKITKSIEMLGKMNQTTENNNLQAAVAA